MSTQQPSCVALIPARSGSERVKGKNIRPLAEHPLIAYTISTAIDSDVFSAVIVSTDSEEIACISGHYGAEVPFLRPPEISGSTSPDIEWVAHTLERLREAGRAFDCFSLLRPTSPFRKAETIRRAWREFLGAEGVDSLRAVEKCRQHPGKMWVVRGNRMSPLLPLAPPKRPWHSCQYQSLPEVYVQNASLEIAWTRVVFKEGTIAGNVLMPFFTSDEEGFDINDEYDFALGERMLAEGTMRLPPVSKEPFPWK